MELLRGTAPKVMFYGPTPSTEVTTAQVSVNGVASSVTAPTRVTNGDAAWELQLPYVDARTNNVEVTWEFTIAGIEETFSETFSYEAVTPYLTKQEILRIFDGEPVTDERIWEVEAAVRHIINAHTGQKFGCDMFKTLRVEGHGESALRLPERLWNLATVETLTSSLSVLSFIIVSDGWYLKKGWADATPRINGQDSEFWGDITDGVFNNNIYKDADDGYNPGYDGLGQLTDPTITPVSSRPGNITVVPGSSGRATVWKQDYPFEITGNWGYRTVPPAVKEAAKLLANDYACHEAAYRDRYLESIKAADWRLQFSSRAWESTGNARADQLLSGYVILDWAII